MHEQRKVALENIESWTGRFVESDSDDYSGNGIQFFRGDVLFGKLRPYLAKAWIADSPGSAVGDFHVYRPVGSVDSRFFLYVLLNPEFLGLIDGSTQGAKMPRANWDYVGDLVQAFPPVSEQCEIADYLDAQTAKIDALIGKQEQLIERLGERLDGAWAALVEELNTKSPRLPLRRVISSIVDGPFGSALTSAHYSEAGVGVVRLGNIGRFEFRLGDRAFVTREYAQTLSTHSVQPGDVVVAGLGDEKMPLGRAAIVPKEFGAGIVKADCYRVRPTTAISGEFLAWSLSSPQARGQFQLMGRGSTRQRLNTQIVRNVVIPVASADDQRSILERFGEIRSSHQALSAKAREMIDVLKERRQALISAAVTGKIDVRGLA